MNSTLDNAITAAAASEATYNADTTNVATIETSIASATAPLAAAQAQQIADSGTFYASLHALSDAALAFAATLPTPAVPAVIR